MGTLSSIKGAFVATWTGIRHAFKPRMTLRYPDQKLDLQGPGYHFDPKNGVGLPGFKGRHFLREDKCTGCQLCAIACDGVAVAIEMQTMVRNKPQNKKNYWPAVDYGRCVPPWTPITTSEGVRPIRDVVVGDNVLTHLGRFRKVTEVFQRKHSGRVYTFAISGNPEKLTVTEGHPILVRLQRGYAWVAADRIRPGDLLVRLVDNRKRPEFLQSSSKLDYSGGLSVQPSNLGGVLILHSVGTKAGGQLELSPVSEVLVDNVENYEVYNLEVEDDHTYVASNHVVHNCVFCGLCVDPETEVATNPGIKPIRQVAVGEHVLTHSGEYKPVTRVWEFAYTGLLYRVKVMGKPSPLVCTADHKIMAVRRPVSTRQDGRLPRKMDPIEMTLPRDLKVGDYLLTPIPKKTIDQEEVRIEFQGSGALQTLRLHTEPELFRLIGYYLSEGSTHLDSRSITLSFGSKETDLIGDASRLLSKYFSKEPSLQRLRQHATNVRIGSSVALKFFLQFGRGAANKSLPDWVFFAPPEKQIQLVKGIFLGDGCVVNQPRQKYLNITTVSNVLANQVQMVLSRLGVVSAIYVENSRNKLPVYRINTFGKWALKLALLMKVPFHHATTRSSDKFLLSADYVFSPIVRIDAGEVRNKPVMDVTVERDHTFVGNGVAQHNCVDACPFDALSMTNEYELSAYDKDSLKYTPDMLMLPPPEFGTAKVKFDPKKGNVTHG